MKTISKAVKYLNRRNMGIAFRTEDIPRAVKPFALDSMQILSNRKKRRVQASLQRSKGKVR